MTRTQYSNKMEKIIKTYGKKQAALRDNYEYYYSQLVNASDILSLNAWYDKENDRINAWYGRSLRKLSEEGWQE